MNKLRDITVMSACKTVDRINRYRENDVITYEEYVQALNDTKRCYNDMIDTFEDYGIASRAYCDELRLYINVRFSE